MVLSKAFRSGLVFLFLYLSMRVRRMGMGLPNLSKFLVTDMLAINLNNLSIKSLFYSPLAFKIGMMNFIKYWMTLHIYIKLMLNSSLLCPCLVK